MALDSDIEACGPYYSLNTHSFDHQVKQPYQMLSEEVHLYIRMSISLPIEACIMLGLYRIVQKSKKLSRSPLKVHGSRQ